MDRGGFSKSMRTLAIALLFHAGAQAGLKRFDPRPVLIHARHPDLPLERFAAGALGIPRPEWARLYLFAVYRHLEGRPLSAAEQQSFLDAWSWRRGHPPTVNAGLLSWLRIKGSRAGEVFRQEVHREDWVTYRPCADDAFALASRTYAERVREFGARSRAVRIWLEGQDAVFDQCLGGRLGRAIPGAAPADAPALIRADRDYQIAAALFYAQRHDEALAVFKRIEGDRASPWRAWAPYLIGRTLLWKARTTATPSEYDPLLKQAEAKFEQVLANPALRVTHEGAELLLVRCLMVTDPRRAAERLSARLSRSGVDPKGRNLFHYLTALDNIFDSQKPPHWSAQPRDAMSQWIVQFGNAQRWTYQNAVAQWRKSGSRAWLYAAISKARPDDPECAALIDAALAVRLDSAVGPMLHFAAADLLARRGEVLTSREAADHVLQRVQALPSASNHVRILRAQIAGSFSEFLLLAPSRIVMHTSEVDFSEFEEADADFVQKMPRLHPEIAALINLRLPLGKLREACTGHEFSSHLRREICMVTFVRAALLDRVEEGRVAMREFAHSYPRIAQGLKTWSAADTASARADAAAVLLVQMPGASALMRSEYGRAWGLFEHDDWGRNWWYGFGSADMLSDMWARAVPLHDPVGFTVPELAFLTPAERDAAKAELERLRATSPRGLDWVTARILAIVRRDPKHPRAAELLSRCVSGTFLNQWAYRAPKQTPLAGDAWRLLSTRYRGSRWFAEAAPGYCMMNLSQADGCPRY